MEKIYYKKKLLAIIIKNYHKKRGINFFTENNFSQQVAFMNHKKNHIIQPHIHKLRLKKIYDTNEVLIILQGKIKVDFFNSNKKYVKSRFIEKGNILILLSGGHGFKILKNCKFIEVKQGPYLINKDKKKFMIQMKF